MPVLKAKGEAEGLCAQLNSEGHVDACITADSDAFLFGAKCVIKCIKPNSRVSHYLAYSADVFILHLYLLVIETFLFVVKFLFSVCLW